MIAENYSECYHCPGVHPQLNKLTPYDRGQNLESDGPWAGGWMELVEDADTMSVDGHTHGRPPLPGLSAEDERRIYYFVVWPNLMLSLHPDYVMTHQVWPVEPGRSRVVCEWLFDPEVMARPDFDASDAVDFWDLTNRQDWRVCELQQEGTSLRRLHARPLLADGGHGPRLRPDVRRPLRRRRRHHAVRAAPRQVARPGASRGPGTAAPRRRPARASACRAAAAARSRP